MCRFIFLKTCLFLPPGTDAPSTLTILFRVLQYVAWGGSIQDGSFTGDLPNIPTSVTSAGDPAAAGWLHSARAWARAYARAWAAWDRCTVRSRAKFPSLVSRQAWPMLRPLGKEDSSRKQLLPRKAVVHKSRRLVLSLHRCVLALRLRRSRNIQVSGERAKR